MKTLLVIGYVWPEPKSSAAGSRMLQLLQVFRGQEYRIIYASPAEASDHAIDLADLGIEAQPIELNSQSFDQFITNLNPQVVMFDRFMMEEQFGWRVEKCCPEALRILDSEDLHFLRHARHAALKAGNQQIIQPPSEYLYSDMAKREIAAILRCDLTLTISRFEMELLQTRFQIPAAILHYCPFMCSHHQAGFDIPSYEQRQHFVSIGNFRHEPNWDAVRYLKEQIWPAIRQQIPEAELHIYGAYPPKKATQLHNEKQGFLVKGWADEALPVVANARVLLAPLRFGAGLKGKLIDAALCHTPAVTTSIGAEGMYGSDGIQDSDASQAAAIADEPAQFVANAIRLYNQPYDWLLSSQGASRVIARYFSYDDHATALAEAVQRLMTELPSHRLNNFYGAMLRHHSLKSSQYMSQWIEAKNKLQAVMAP
ncbi:glycosyltransferase family 4 protein [Bacterioplanoides sp.]|uniref:glycosyltransferase family 4 protein n=1 Tax=Bacterioplanoides sp. TaxID=2066072 RepID=UPI003AFFB92F